MILARECGLKMQMYAYSKLLPQKVTTFFPLRYTEKKSCTFSLTVTYTQSRDASYLNKVYGTMLPVYMSELLLSFFIFNLEN